MYGINAEQRRLEALKLAVAAGASSHAKSIIEHAKSFEAYLRGDVPEVVLKQVHAAPKQIDLNQALAEAGYEIRLAEGSPVND